MCDSEEDMYQEQRSADVLQISDEEHHSDEEQYSDEEEAYYQSHHSAPFSSENEAQGGDPGGWQCTPPQSSSPSQPLPSRDHAHSQSPSPTRSIGKKRSSKPQHMRRNIRKLLRDHQLEVTTKAAQQEELERRRRLEQQRKQDYPLPLLPEYTTADVTNHVKPSSVSTTAASQQEVQVRRQEVACLDSSSTGIREEDCKPEALGSHKTALDEDSAVPSSRQSPAEEGDSEPSGAHVNDALNLPDAQGRVLVNTNHPQTDPDIYLSPQLARAVKPHQIGGIRFLYDNLVESLERFSTSPGFGCILAHSMGLGKTLQVISFIDVLFRHTKAHTVLAIVPVNTLQNWLHEFNTWVPAAESLPPDVDHKLITPRAFRVHILNDEHKNTTSRAKVVEDWYSDGGVLLMGYEMYRLLSLKKSFVAGRKKKNKKNPTSSSGSAVDVDEEDRQQELLKGIEKALARPGPDVVICDEGHRIKNCHASTSQALKNIRTRRRVVLTGYPLQNNLIEYWCMVDFVRPDFLGTRQEFSNMFERPILNGQCVDSTPQDLQLMRYRSHVLHSLLEGFVQRRGHDVLKEQLPSKEEHVILVRLSPLQRALYTEFMNRFREAGNTGWLSLNPLKAFCVCCKIWNHPDVLYEALQKENLASEQDLDLDDITSSRCHTTANQKPKPLETPNPIGGLSLSQMQEKANQVITYEWAKEIMNDYKPGVLENSAKMVLLFHMIEESVRKGDKLLVFSQSLSTLTVIEEFLAKRPVPPSPNSNKDKSNQNWVRNLNYYRLDGSTTASERERLINQFNDPANTSAWVFLLSTRAGCLGVNLIGANRVVVFDASWNPCHDAQAVCRVYRYGQKKHCHIYRLVCDFTLEKKIYDRQISKQGMSDRVVDDLNPVLTFTRREVESLLHFVEEEPDPKEVKLRPNDHLESVLKRALCLYPHLITKQPFAHESLLMDRREMKLSSAEKKEAKKGYEEEKRASVPYTRPSYAHYYPASDQSLTNIPAFSQRNWRPPARVEDKPMASVRPVKSTTDPTMPRQATAAAPNSDSASSDSKLGGFPVNCLQKAGVVVQKIVTTTDMVIPGTNSSADVQARITAGESIHIIRGTKGTYIRTSDGRIFAIRAANKAKALEENTTAPSKDSQPKPQDLSSTGSNGCVSPDRKLPSLPRPISPDSPEIIDELQRYTRTSEQKPQPPQLNGTALPNMADVTFASASSAAPQDLRIGSKRKSSSPVSEEQRPSKQPSLGQPHSSATAALASQSYPFNSAYSLPHIALNPAALSRSLYMNSPYFQASQLGESGYMYPDISTTTPTTSVSTSFSSVKPNSSGIPPYMLNPNVASLSGMLPPGFPMAYTQSLANLYSKSMLNGDLLGPAATPGPAGASFLSKFPTSAESNKRGSVLVNGANISSASSSDNDDDVIEVKEN
ncbi:helicase ARIP4-like isoform X2 [Boleophthalmus pectinirostris]|uniref:helicase ARIP4-like isoform X2 n=1 Tax=Boleophthalmus pectinirostris TaxID=150288 RepID=UPI002431DC23|nr:helicase ARIP4-like isoform X2 [Boleophthalmus pectinirostris]